MAIEIVDLPIKNGGSFHSYVSLPEGNFPQKKHGHDFLPAASYPSTPGNLDAPWGSPQRIPGRLEKDGHV